MATRKQRIQALESKTLAAPHDDKEITERFRLRCLAVLEEVEKIEAAKKLEKGKKADPKDPAGDSDQ